MPRSRRRTGKHTAHGVPHGQGPAPQSEAYRQTIADRKARQLAKKRAEVEIANMHFTYGGDFSHLAAQPMRVRYA